jgi:hypothetical protein
MSERKGYLGASAAYIIDKLGMYSRATDALKNVRVDGVPILELEDTLRTPRPFEVRPTTKHREAFAAGVAFSSILRLGQVDISTKLPDGTNRETPDLLVETSEKRYDVEAVRVDETAGAKSHLYEIQARFAKLLHDNPELKINYPVLFTVDFENVRNLTASEFEQLGDELCDFFRSGCWRYLKKVLNHSVFADGTLAARVGLAVRVEQPPYDDGITFERVDGLTPLPLVLSAIEEKRMKTYTRHGQELWLVVEIVDRRGPFVETIRAINADKPAIAPFDHVCVYDSMSLAAVVL